MNRRRFLHAASIAAAAPLVSSLIAPAGAAEFTGKIKKAVKYHMVAGSMPIVEKFALLKELGYDGVEVRTRDRLDPKELEQARDKTGLPIHGTINSSEPDIRSAIDLSKRLGGTTVLVVAGRVTDKVAYDDNWREWSARLKENAPYAEKQNIRILVENVWNNFLLSPLEMRQFIDEVGHPFVGVYFDIGNVVRLGYPEQWIRILGPRIGKLDIKPFSREKMMNEGHRNGFDIPLGSEDDSVDWPAVREELKKLNFTGWATAEVKGGDREYLADLAKRMDNVLAL